MNINNKIAIMYSGLTSPFNQSIYDNHKKYLLDHYDCDIYMSTWKHSSNECAFSLLQPTNYNIEDYSELEPMFLDMEKLVTFKFPETKVLNVFSMYYNIYKAFNSVLQHNYNAYVRIRFDIKFDSTIQIIFNDYVHIPEKGNHRGGILDLFGYGDYNRMSAYCNTFLHISDYLKAKLVCHPETILKHSLLSNDIKINRTKQNIYLRDHLFTK